MGGTHTVTASFRGYWVYPSSTPSGLVPLLGYSYSPFTRLAPHCLRRLSDCHGHAPQLRSVVVLHCLPGGCQRLEFLSNICNATLLLVAPAPPLLFFHSRLLRVSQVVYQLFYFFGVYAKRFPVDSSPGMLLMFLIPPL